MQVFGGVHIPRVGAHGGGRHGYTECVLLPLVDKGCPKHNASRTSTTTPSRSCPGVRRYDGRSTRGPPRRNCGFGQREAFCIMRAPCVVQGLVSRRPKPCRSEQDQPHPPSRFVAKRGGQPSRYAARWGGEVAERPKIHRTSVTEKRCSCGFQASFMRCNGAFGMRLSGVAAAYTGHARPAQIGW